MKRLSQPFCVLVLLVAAAAGQMVPVNLTMSIRPGSKPIQIGTVVNQYRAPLTAFMLEAIIHGNKGVWPMFDARINLRTVPIKPGENLALPVPPDVTPSSVVVTAALFADGTSAGDPNAVAILIARRQALLSQLDAIDAKLHTMQGQGLDVSAVVAALKGMDQDDMQRMDQDYIHHIGSFTLHSYVVPMGHLAYQLAIGVLQDMKDGVRAATTDDAIPEILKTLQDHRQALQADNAVALSGA